MKIKTDFLIIGSGLYGSVIAERIANKLKKKSNNFRKKKTHRGQLLFKEG